MKEKLDGRQRKKRNSEESLYSPTPLKILIIIVVSVFIIETAIMIFIHRYFNISHTLEIILDPIFLALGIIPVLYIYLLRPMELQIRKRKEAEEQIKGSLREKEILLKEIHHRVKNNLQVVSSILNLQSGYIDDTELKGIFKESQDRIRSMALVHTQLYQSKDISNISLPEYIKTLIENIFSSYAYSPSQVDLKMNIEDIQLDIDTSIVLGLILNELCTNALKYAFPVKQGKLKIDFKSSDNDNYMLVVSDNGVGLPEDFEVDKTNSMGFLLIENMVKQLDGTLEIDQSSGSSFTITFPR